jgi:hypothetical protein
MAAGRTPGLQETFGEVVAYRDGFIARRRDGVERRCGSLAEAEEFLMRHVSG